MDSFLRTLSRSEKERKPAPPHVVEVRLCPLPACRARKPSESKPCSLAFDPVLPCSHLSLAVKSPDWRATWAGDAAASELEASRRCTLTLVVSSVHFLERTLPAHLSLGVFSFLWETFYFQKPAPKGPGRHSLVTRKLVTVSPFRLMPCLLCIRGPFRHQLGVCRVGPAGAVCVDASCSVHLWLNVTATWGSPPLPCTPLPLSSGGSGSWPGLSGGSDQARSHTLPWEWRAMIWSQGSLGWG